MKGSHIEPKALAELVIQAANEKKADGLTIIDLTGRADYCDFFVLCNGSHARQVMAIAQHITHVLKTEHSITPKGVEGMSTGRWVLIDLGDIVVHVFETSMRDHYDLDGLWMDADRLDVEALLAAASEQLAADAAAAAAAVVAADA